MLRRNNASSLSGKHLSLFGVLSGATWSGTLAALSVVLEAQEVSKRDLDVAAMGLKVYALYPHIPWTKSYFCSSSPYLLAILLMQPCNSLLQYSFSLCLLAIFIFITELFFSRRFWLF